MSVSTDEQQTIIVQPKRHWSQLGLLILAWALGVMRAALAPLAPADRAEAAWTRASALCDLSLIHISEPTRPAA